MKIGDKVVCIDERLINPYDDGPWHSVGVVPKQGSVYVIASFFIHPETGILGLILIGSSAICDVTGREIGWHSDRFRLLDEMKEESKQKHSQQISAIKPSRQRQQRESSDRSPNFCL